MPEATILYTVTGVVVLGLVVWVAAVLKVAREPWARPPPQRLSEAGSIPPAPPNGDEPGVGTNAAAEPELERRKDASKLDADSTAKATPVALAGEAKARAAAGDDDANA